MRTCIANPGIQPNLFQCVWVKSKYFNALLSHVALDNQCIFQEMDILNQTQVVIVFQQKYISVGASYLK